MCQIYKPTRHYTDDKTENNNKNPCLWPQTGIFIIILGFVVGVMSGWFVDLTHPKNFLTPKEKIISVNNKREKEISTNFKIIWTILIVPGLIIGIMMAFQVDVNEYFKIGSIQNIASLFGFLAGLLKIQIKKQYSVLNQF